MPVKETNFIEFGFHIAENLAYKKRTWQSSTRSHYSSDKAVDGKMTIRMGSGSQCAISGGNVSEAMWMVDLGDVYAIRAIFIYFRIEESKIENHEVASRILGFSVYASNTSRIVDGKLCYHENNNTIESMPSQTIVNCIVQARYIIYYNSRLSPPLRSADYSKFAYIDLCEVEVYGCTRFGFYGEFCEKPCPWNCKHCHPSTGECVGGCSTGYYGHHCLLFNRDKNNQYTSRFLGFSIVVSNTTNPRDGVVCFRDTKLNRYTIPAVSDIDCHVTGRYVIYYNERNPELGYPQDYSQFAYAELCEVEVYGCPFAEFNGPTFSVPCRFMCDDQYLENLAFRRPTWLSASWGGYTAEKAVDGRKANRHYASGPCTVSPDIQEVTWRVDLQRIRKIEYIKIYFRTDNRPFVHQKKEH
ncbi:uncharacterized protein LOC144624441 [Crassostrea virginica]